MKKTAIRVTALCLSLLLSWLLLLSSCAPAKPAEEQTAEGLGGNETVSSGEVETDPAADMVFAFDRKISFVWDESREYLTDSVLVVLKSSASDPEKEPCAESFPELELLRAEILFPIGYRPQEGRDWGTYFAAEERERENFRWRVRLYLKEPGEENLRQACERLNQREDVAEIELTEKESAKYEKKIPFEQAADADFEPGRLIVALKHSYSDPYDAPRIEDFSDLGIESVEYLFLEDRAVNSPEEFDWNSYFSNQRTGKEGFCWYLSLQLKTPTTEEVERIGALLDEMDAVSSVGRNWYYAPHDSTDV